jgi:hypothetical protein
LTGHFERNGVKLSFDSIRTAALFRFEVITEDGTILIRGEQIAEQKFVTHVLNSRLNITYDLTAGADNVTSDGDETALAAAEATPEYAQLPWLSNALGNNGYNGRDYPSALALHMFNRGVAEKLNVKMPKVQRPELSDETGYCTAYPNSGNSCYGMCGPGCTCWSFVCGDCCYHNGCATHDSYCRGSGWADKAKCWSTWGAAFFGC